MSSKQAYDEPTRYATVRGVTQVHNMSVQINDNRSQSKQL